LSGLDAATLSLEVGAGAQPVVLATLQALFGLARALQPRQTLHLAWALGAGSSRPCEAHLLRESLALLLGRLELGAHRRSGCSTRRLR